MHFSIKTTKSNCAYLRFAPSLQIKNDPCIYYRVDSHMIMTSLYYILLQYRRPGRLNLGRLLPAKRSNTARNAPHRLGDHSQDFSSTSLVPKFEPSLLSAEAGQLSSRLYGWKRDPNLQRCVLTGFIIVALHQPYMHWCRFRDCPLPLGGIAFSPTSANTLSEKEVRMTGFVRHALKWKKKRVGPLILNQSYSPFPPCCYTEEDLHLQCA